MSRKSFEPKDCIAALNNIKTGFQMRDVPITKEQLLSSFRNCGLPTTYAFFKLMKEFGVIQRASKGKYIFPNKNPIYIGVLENIKKKYREILDLRNQKTTPVTSELVVSNREQECIDFLKNLGYIILQPVVNFKQVLILLGQV